MLRLEALKAQAMEMDDDAREEALIAERRRKRAEIAAKFKAEQAAKAEQ